LTSAGIGSGVERVADRSPHAVAVDAGRQDLAQRPFFVQEPLDLRLHRVGTLLRADLADLAVFLRRGHGLQTFPLAVRQGLLHVHVLAGLHRPDRSQTVPVVRSGDHHRVDVRIVEHASHIRPRFGGRVKLAGTPQLDLIRIAQAGNRNTRQLAERTHQICRPRPPQLMNPRRTAWLGSAALNKGAPSQSGTRGKASADKIATMKMTHR
jgi:hypothetical protein